MWRHAGPCLLLVIVLALSISGCGGGGSNSPVPPPPPVDAVERSLEAPLPTALVETPAGSQGVLLLEEMTNTPPATTLELRSFLDRVATWVADHPNDSAGQFAMILGLLKYAIDDLSDKLGYDLIKDVAGTSNLGPLELQQLATGKKLQETFLGRDESALNVATKSLDTAQVQATIRDTFLYVLFNSDSAHHGIIQRLEAIAALGGNSRLFQAHLGANRCGGYSSDFLAMSAGTRLLRAVLLTLISYNAEDGNYDWHQPPWRTFEVGAAATPAQYLPPDPFLTLRPDGDQYMNEAIADARLAAERLKQAVAAAASDPECLIRWALGEYGGTLGKISHQCDDVTRLLSTEGVTVTVQWECYAKCTWQPQPVIEDIQLHPAALWDNPQSDFKDLFPTMHVQLVEGKKALRLLSASDAPDLTFGGAFGAQNMDTLIEALFNPPGDEQRYTMVYRSPTGETYRFHLPLPTP